MTKPSRETCLPFRGLYETIDAGIVSDIIDNYFTNEETGEPEPPENFYVTFNHRPAYLAYAKAYTAAFSALLNEELGTAIKLDFKELESPKYYNYKTDRIVAGIRVKDIKELWRHTSKEALKSQIEKRHTSYSGFHSFYSNDINEWLAKPVLQWDHNDLCTLLHAAVATACNNPGSIAFDASTFEHSLYQTLYESDKLRNEIETLVYQWAQNQEKVKTA